MCVYVGYILPDSVEEGEKIVNAAVDKFGRIGETLLIYVTQSLTGSNDSCWR